MQIDWLPEVQTGNKCDEAQPGQHQHARQRAGQHNRQRLGGRCCIPEEARRMRAYACGGGSRQRQVQQQEARHVIVMAQRRDHAGRLARKVQGHT